MSRLMLRRADHRPWGAANRGLWHSVAGWCVPILPRCRPSAGRSIFRPKPECVVQQNCGLGNKILKLVTSWTPISDWQICMRKRHRDAWCFEDETVLNLQLCGKSVDYNRSVKNIISAIRRDSDNFFTAKRMRAKCQK